jgi:hypothetical protein
MIIAFAFGLIGAILVLANNRYLRIFKINLTAFIVASILAVLGIYFIISASKETDRSLLFPMFTPLTALIILHFTRILYKKYIKKEIILHLHGLFPIRQEDRYVTRLEINITFVILILSVIIPFLVLIILL